MTCGHRERGSVALEFAMLVPVLLLLVLGVFNLVVLIEEGITVAGAAAAGAQFGAAEGNASNISGMQTAAGNSAKGFSGSMTVTATSWCICSAGSPVKVGCLTLCNNGVDPPLQYVQVKTQVTVPLLIPFASLPVSSVLYGSSTMRSR